jgi:hypothetical protein
MPANGVFMMKGRGTSLSLGGESDRQECLSYFAGTNVCGVAYLRESGGIPRRIMSWGEQ